MSFCYFHCDIWQIASLAVLGSLNRPQLYVLLSDKLCKNYHLWDYCEYLGPKFNRTQLWPLFAPRKSWIQIHIRNNWFSRPLTHEIYTPKNEQLCTPLFSRKPLKPNYSYVFGRYRASKKPILWVSGENCETNVAKRKETSYNKQGCFYGYSRFFLKPLKLYKVLL